MAGERSETQATYCATLVDEWIALGVHHAVVAPGSRSTPMALALADRSEIELHVVHDERVAAFVALGLALEGRPALLLCTSGTAAANFLPAVVEAALSEVPMLVLTADRPARLRGVGAPQTIDQVELYGRHVRWFRDAPVPAAVERGSWRALAGDAWRHSVTGPVHLNLQFDEPLVGAPGELPPPGSAPTPTQPERAVDPVPDGVDRQRGVIIAGGRSGVAAPAVEQLHHQTRWPVLADPLSGLRHLDGVVTTFDALLRHPRFADDHLPEVVVRVGRPPASKVLTQWVVRATSNAQRPATLVQVGGPGVIDPDLDVTAVCRIDALLAAQLRGATGTPWLARWQHAEHRAEEAIRSVLAAEHRLSEPGVARAVAEHLPGGAVLTVASSMPVRDLEWFGGPRARAHANRGANGIDGVVSTALGRALQGRPSVALVGDLAFVHDTNALVALSRRGADLRIVVVDNDGGGIFSFLPQATDPGGERFEELFGTPLHTDVVRLAAAHGVAAATITEAAELGRRLQEPGPWLVRVPSDRADNVAVHTRLNAAVARALG